MVFLMLYSYNKIVEIDLNGLRAGLFFSDNLSHVLVLQGYMLFQFMQQNSLMIMIVCIYVTIEKHNHTNPGIANDFEISI